MVRYCCEGDSLIQSLIYSIGVFAILVGLTAAINISCEELCRCWDIEMPTKAVANLRMSEMRVIAC